MNCIACQAPLSLGFSRQQYWSGLPFPSPGDLPNTGLNPHLLHWQKGSLPLSHQRSPVLSRVAFADTKVLPTPGPRSHSGLSTAYPLCITKAWYERQLHAPSSRDLGLSSRENMEELIADLAKELLGSAGTGPPHRGLSPGQQGVPEAETWSLPSQAALAVDGPVYPYCSAEQRINLFSSFSETGSPLLL